VGVKGLKYTGVEMHLGVIKGRATSV